MLSSFSKYVQTTVPYLLGLAIVFTAACSGSDGLDSDTLDISSPGSMLPEPANPDIAGNRDETLEIPSLAPALPGSEAAPLEDDSVVADLSNDILVPPEAPILEITASTSQLNFEWQKTDDTAVVSLIQNDRLSRETKVIASNFEPGTNTYSLEISPLLFQWQTTDFILEICEQDDCLRSFSIPVASLVNNSITRIEDSTAAAFDFFGASIDSAAGGRVVVIGAPGADTTLDDAEVNDNFSTPDSGRASLLFEVDGLWWPGAVLESVTAYENAQFGYSIAADLNADNIVVGAPGDSHQAELAGSAFTFIRAGETWIQNNELLPGIARSFAAFGHAVAMSDDQQIIAVASPGDPNASHDPFSTDESLINAGSVSIYRYDPFIDEWLFSDYLQAEFPESGARFGEALSMSDDGSVLAVSAPGSVEGDGQTSTGSVYLFELLNSGSQQLQKFTAQTSPVSTNATQEDVTFGSELSLSADASTLAIASLDKRIFAEQPGLNGNSPEKPQSEIQIFRRNQTLQYEKAASITPSGDHGSQNQLSLAISASGDLLATGVLNPSGIGNSLSIHELLATDIESGTLQWTMVNSFAQPQSGASNFASLLTFAGSGRRLFVGADGAGSVFVY